MLYYIRDEEGSLIGFKYNDMMYYYIKNMQEDIIGLTDENFNEIVRYAYDPWGKIISIKDNNNNEITNTSHIGIINPFRYRSYYYDNETKLYYLNSRYYNPEWGRFINPDKIIGNPNERTDYNLYSYTSNNPINNHDNDGKFGVTLTAAALAKIAYASLLSLTAYVATKMTIDATINGGISIPMPNYTYTKSNTKTNTKDKTKEQTWMLAKDKTISYSSSQTPCWEARRDINGKDVELGNKLSIARSVERVRLGGDVMCNTKFNAEKVANAFPLTKFGPEQDKSQKPGHTYYWHYHPYGKDSHIHVWYYY